MLNETAGLARIVPSISWTQSVILRPSNNPERLHLFFSPLKKFSNGFIENETYISFSPFWICVHLISEFGWRKEVLFVSFQTSDF